MKILRLILLLICFLNSSINASFKKFSHESCTSYKDKSSPQKNSNSSSTKNRKYHKCRNCRGFTKRIEITEQKIKKEKEKEKEILIKDNNESITIMVHGTTLTTNTLTWPKPVNKLLSKYLRTPKGFLNFDELEPSHQFIQLAKELNLGDNKNFGLSNFYFFGWNGALNSTERKNSAEDLYKAILKLKEKHKDIPITIITHSHGGNVALNLANISKEKNDNNFYIDRLILLGCPVQDETEDLINSSVFKKIYNFYSPGDLIQVLDPQGYNKKNCKTFFSRRLFKPSSKLYQIKVLLNGHSLYHMDFISIKFHKKLSAILNAIDKLTKEENSDNNQHFSVDIQIKYKNRRKILSQKAHLTKILDITQLDCIKSL